LYYNSLIPPFPNITQKYPYSLVLLNLFSGLITGGAPDFKNDDHKLVAWYETVLSSLGVEIKLNAEANKETAAGFDAVIVAAGSRPKIFNLGDPARTFSAAEVLLKQKDPGDKTVVIGGGLVGCELALWLRECKKEVTIVEALPKLLCLNAPLCHANSEMLERLVPYKGISVITGAKALGYKDGVLELDNGQKLSCDSVILAAGYSENSGLYAELEPVCADIHVIGDARRVSNIMYAIWDAFEVASTL
jgi:2-enoate reductase